MFKSALRDTGLVLLGMGIAIGITAKADKAEFAKAIDETASKFSADAGYSDCRYTASPDGQWYQKDQEHSSRYKAGCGTFGLGFKATEDFTLGVHYVQLGRTNVEALAVAFPGDNRALMTADIIPTRPACSPSFSAGCLYQWHTGSFTRGLNLSASYKLFDLGPVRFEGKGGLYFHKLSSTAVVEPLGCRDNCPWRVTVDQSAMSVGPMWGAVVRWKYFYASWESFERIGAHTQVTANVKGPVEVKTIGVSIPL